MHPQQYVFDAADDRGREIGAHGREHTTEDRERTHARAWVPTTDIFVLDGRLVIRIELAGVDDAALFRTTDAIASWRARSFMASGMRKAGLTSSQWSWPCPA